MTQPDDRRRRMAEIQTGEKIMTARCEWKLFEHFGRRTEPHMAPIRDLVRCVLEPDHDGTHEPGNGATRDG